MRRALLLAALPCVFSLSSCRRPTGPVSRNDVPGVIDQLASSPSARDAAEQRLVQTPPVDSWTPLLKLLDAPATSAPAARMAAIRIIGKGVKGEAKVPAAVGRASATDPDPGVRREALLLLAAQGHPEYRLLLEDRAANEPDPALKAEVGKILAAYHDNERTWYRGQAAHNPREKDRVAAIRELGSRGTRTEDVPALAADFTVETSQLCRYEILLALSALGGDLAADVVLDHIADENPFFRAASIIGEQRLKDPRAVPLLQKALAVDNIGDNRVSAAAALAAIGGDAARAALAKECDNQPTVMIRTACTSAKSTLAAAPHK